MPKQRPTRQAMDAARHLYQTTHGLYLWLAPRDGNDNVVQPQHLTDEALAGHTPEWRAWLRSMASALLEYQSAAELPR